LTEFLPDGYDSSRTGGPLIPDERSVYDFQRLERAVTALAEAHRRQCEQAGALRRKVEEKTRRIRSLEGQLLEANQRRQDVTKRVDEMIAQLDHLDAQFRKSDA
jgi:septal ring factor EnvC (AmiA/AmiB activator)